MKTNIFLFFILFFSNQIYSQSLIGTYTRQQIKSTGDDTRISEKGKIPEVFSYTYSQNKSIQKLTTIQKSSIDTTAMANTGGKIYSTYTVHKSSEIINYKDFDSKTYKVLTTTDGVDINIKAKLPIHNWELLPETKIINGFCCKKATTKNTEFNSKQNITAWYAEEIPVKDGPMFYSGLPGFIIQLEIDDSSILTFQELTFNKNNTIIQTPNNKAKELSFEEYSNQKN